MFPGIQRNYPERAGPDPVFAAGILALGIPGNNVLLPL